MWSGLALEVMMLVVSEIYTVMNDIGDVIIESGTLGSGEHQSGDVGDPSDVDNDDKVADADMLGNQSNRFRKLKPSKFRYCLVTIPTRSKLTSETRMHNKT